MGSRALLEVLKVLQSSSFPTAMLKQLILAAPDVDTDIFSQLTRLLHSKCERITLYASSNDKALKASKTLHAFPRAGQAGADLVVFKGVDTIDASEIDTDFLGHSVFAEERPLIQDMFYLIEHGHAPSSRFGLVRHNGTTGTYWSFKK
jgi:esterase/lipase superfamily enzyme